MTHILKDQKIWFDGYDLTGQSNAIGLDYGVEAKDATVLGNDTRVNVAGLLSVAASVQGFWNADEDQALFDNVGAAGKVLTFGNSGTEGSLVYMFPALLGQLQMDGQIGEILPFSLNAGARGNLVRGTLMENDTNVTATQYGTARNLGAVSASQKLYAGLHVLGANGSGDSTLDITVESDSADDFTGSETEQIAFTQVTGAVGSQFVEVNGAITDTWLRVVATLGGTSPDYDFVVSLGIL